MLYNDALFETTNIDAELNLCLDGKWYYVG